MPITYEYNGRKAIFDGTFYEIIAPGYNDVLTPHKGYAGLAVVGNDPFPHAPKLDINNLLSCLNWLLWHDPDVEFGNVITLEEAQEMIFDIYADLLDEYAAS